MVNVAAFGPGDLGSISTGLLSQILNPKLSARMLYSSKYHNAAMWYPCRYQRRLNWLDQKNALKW